MFYKNCRKIKQLKTANEARVSCDCVTKKKMKRRKGAVVQHIQDKDSPELDEHKNPALVLKPHGSTQEG